MDDKYEVPGWLSNEPPPEDHQWDLLDQLITEIRPRVDYSARHKFMGWVLLGLAGEKCVLCDSKENLDFHHKDGRKREKSEYFNYKLGRCSDKYFWEKIVPEAMNDCILVCKKCHRALHKSNR